MNLMVGLAFLLTTTSAVVAQQSADSVTVTGLKSRTAINQYLESITINTAMAGKIARWDRTAICPLAVGLKPAYLEFITRRVREVAVEVGAPVNSSPKCAPNIRIVFTTTPQALLDNIRKENPGFLGYYRTSRQGDEIAKVTRPIQAWYSTETVDWRGRRFHDVRIIGMCADIFSPDCPLTHHVSGFKSGDGVRSGFENVVIVINPEKVSDHEMGPLADYVVMLALSQPRLSDECQKLPSILDLLVPNCSAVPKSITPADLGFLRSLYQLRGLSVGMRNHIAVQMEKDFVAAH